MDWSKAKTILIVAFLITNVLLGFVLFSSEKPVETTIKDGFIEDVTNLLKKKDISINTEIPREIPSLNTLIVEYEIVDTYNINQNYFNGQGKAQSKEQGVSEIVYKDEYVRITNKKTLFYENKKETEIYRDLDKDKAITIAMEFLENRKYNTSDMELFFIKEKDNSYYLEFSKMYNNRYLEKSYNIIEVDARGVKAFERIWLNFLEEGETLIYISTAPKAILSLLSMEEVYGKTIKDISLCYYFDPSEQDYVKESKDPRKGKAIPAWRVLFDDGYKIIIDNY